MNAPKQASRADAAALPVRARTHRLTPFARLIIAVVAANLALSALIGGAAWTSKTAFAIAGMNVFLATIVRQQYVVNLLFRWFGSARHRVPVRIRWGLGKVYHFGGVHVGAAVSATGWYAVFATTTLIGGAAPMITITTVVAAALFAAILIPALPPVRAKHHNLFELTHRFGGWALLLTFWIQALVQMSTRATATPRVDPLSIVSLVLLAVATVSVLLPWLRLRRVPVRIERPSSHVALVEFDYGVTPFAGSSTAVSRSPWREWHSFANVPSPGREGFRLTISRAGDWTGRFIDEAPSHVWVKGIPTAGVGNIDRLFRSVLWVATGSGIGPCLPHLLARTAPAELIWSTRHPRSTYGDALVEEIVGAVPDAVIWNTTTQGKPDLFELAYAHARRTGVEAVICIANQATTRRVVAGFEQRGVPAFGAIWDS